MAPLSWVPPIWTLCLAFSTDHLLQTLLPASRTHRTALRSTPLLLHMLCPLPVLPSVRSMSNASVINPSQSQAGAPWLLYSQGWGHRKRFIYMRNPGPRVPRTGPLALQAPRSPVQFGQAELRDWHSSGQDHTARRGLGSWTTQMVDPEQRRAPGDAIPWKNHQVRLHTVTSALLLVLRCRGPRP